MQFVEKTLVTCSTSHTTDVCMCVCVRVHAQLGGHRRGKKKRDEMAQLVRKQRAQAQSDKQ